MDAQLPLHNALNAIYQPLHQAAVQLYTQLRSFEPSACFRYYNLHDVKIGGQYRTEYFPLPEIELREKLCADIGFFLDGSVWLEIAVPREKALLLDYETLKKQLPALEVYGCKDYLADYCLKNLDSASVYRAIEATDSENIEHFIPLGPPDSQVILYILELFTQKIS